MVVLDGKEYTFTKTIDLDVLNADELVYIGIDGSHHNEYVAGNYKDKMCIRDRDLARQHVAAGAGAALDAGHRARRGIGDRPLAVIMRVLGADHIGAVADADARERAVGRVEGVVIGRKTRHGDLAADGEVLHILGGGDVAVDEDAGDIAVLVADHDGLNKAVFKLEALDEAAEGDETAEDLSLIHI